MVKMLSGICFSISLVMYFLKKANQVNSKNHFLNDITNFIVFVKDSIRYTRTDIMTIQKASINKFPYLKFLTDGVNNNCFGYEKYVNIFMQGIGTTDITGQMELCDRHYDFFKKAYDFEKENNDKNMKTYFALGLFSAAAILVVFI